MVSFQSSFSPPERKVLMYKQDNLSYLNKRKWEQQGGGDDRPAGTKHQREDSGGHETVDVSLHLRTPLPIEWQQCLHLHTDQVHFYETRAQKKTSRDPRQSPPPMSLDLKLNLPNESNVSKNFGRSSSGHSRSLSWVSLIEEENEEGQEEMVAAVCMRCHMLVMLCKSSPSCPNCKFLHPPVQDTLDLFKPNLSLLCCKD